MLSIPVTFPDDCYRVAYAIGNDNQQATGDLNLIALYYFLRVEGYSYLWKLKQHRYLVRATRTVQFRIKDIDFFKDGKILPKISNLDDFLEVDSTTMKITN